jgi:peptidoglycan/xylan/chitin deacetylase (PgdA/CDA1 family)
VTHPAVDWAKGQGRIARALLRWGALPYHLLRRARRPGVVVLLYHRVGGATRSDIDMPLELFERQIRYLRRHCLCVSLDEVAKIPSRKDLERASRDLVVVTFDDAFSDTYELVFPVLRRYGVPATVYVPTRYVEERRPFDFGAFRDFEPSRRPTPMAWEQAAEMAHSGLISIGAHTHTHADLSRTPVEAAGREFEEADRLIEARIGVRPKHFAYPWGRWAPQIQALAAGRYETVAFGGPGRNAYVGLDPKRLWRYPVIQSDGFWLFRARLHLLRERDGTRPYYGPRTAPARPAPGATAGGGSPS